MMKIPCSSCG